MGNCHNICFICTAHGNTKNNNQSYNQANKFAQHGSKLQNQTKMPFLKTFFDPSPKNDNKKKFKKN